MAGEATTTTINPAFMQEIKEDHQELWQLLALCHALCDGSNLVDTPPNQTAELLEQLRDRLAMHFALEEAFGYFDDPLNAAPQLASLAARLKAQHATFYQQLCAVVERAERHLYHESHAGSWHELAAAFLRFHAALQEHEAQENELILDAFDNDLGVGD